MNEFKEKVVSIAEKYAELTEKRLLAALNESEVDNSAMQKIGDGIRMLHHVAATLESISHLEESELTLEISPRVVEKASIQEGIMMKEKRNFSYAMEQDPETSYVKISPMNGENSITIHGEKEALFFTNHLLDYFRIG